MRLKLASTVAGVDLSDQDILKMMAEWSLLHRSNDRLATLSNGLRRRVSVLSALVPALKSESQMIVMLDEPSEGMDKASKELLRSSIEELRSQGHTVIIATHDQDLSCMADRSVEIENQTISVIGEHQLGVMEQRILPLTAVIRSWNSAVGQPLLWNARIRLTQSRG